MDPEIENEKDEESAPDGESVRAETETPVIRREVCLSGSVVILVGCIRYFWRTPF